MALMWKAVKMVCPAPQRPVLMRVAAMSAQPVQEPLKVSVIDEKKGIAEICLQKPPVNSLDRGMLTDLAEGVRRLEGDGCRGLLVTSGVRGIFSAGLNLPDLYNQQKPDLIEFWGMVQQMFLNFYSSSMVTVACISGAAPAAGSLIATSCDYRILLNQPKTVIGLNESLVGLPVPDWMRMNFCDVVGRRQTDLALQMGLLFPPPEALRIGLVDELAESGSLLREQALKKMEHFLKVPDVGRVASKRISTEPLVSYLSGRRQKDAELFVAGVSQEGVQAVMGKYIAALKNKKG